MPSVCVFTHRRAAVVARSVSTLVEQARALGIELLASQEEAHKHPALESAAAAASAIGWPKAAMSADLAIVLGGDGTLLHVLRQLEGGPPVMGINYGILGYLSAAGANDLEQALQAIVDDDLVEVQLPQLWAQMGDDRIVALNDVVASGGASGGIIEVAWRIVRPSGADGTGSETLNEMGVIPCDGMVLATPVGSTAYNLSNGGPVLAWGVDGFVVSFIAPHTLAARPLVVAPDHHVELEHAGRGAPLRLFADGNRFGSLQAGERLRIGFQPSNARLAVFSRPSFYARYRDCFAGQIQTFDRNRVQGSRT
jgi:NAD+ kinase